MLGDQRKSIREDSVCDEDVRLLVLASHVLLKIL